MGGNIGVEWTVSNDAKMILACWVGLCLLWFYEYPKQMFDFYKCMTSTNA